MGRNISLRMNGERGRNMCTYLPGSRELARRFDVPFPGDRRVSLGNREAPKRCAQGRTGVDLSEHRPDLSHHVVDPQIRHRVGVDESGHEISLGLEERNWLRRNSDQKGVAVRRQFDVTIDAEQFRVFAAESQHELGPIHEGDLEIAVRDPAFQRLERGYLTGPAGNPFRYRQIIHRQDATRVIGGRTLGVVLLKLWKPFGVLTKFTDTEGRPTLADYCDVPDVYPVGRLDQDSEGLLLLTDDGVLAHRLTDPKFDHPKTYWAQVERVPDTKALAELRRGVILKDGLTKPAQAQLLDADPDLPPRDPPIRHRLSVPTAWIELTITEGRNRQVRRMTAAVGHPTLRLVRARIGGVGLDDLKPGEWRALSSVEERTLRALRRS